MREREGICFGGIFKLIFPEDEKTFGFQKFYKTGVCINDLRNGKALSKYSRVLVIMCFF
jgi:hypothetical protein